jgi:hypothetical protein
MEPTSTRGYRPRMLRILLLALAVAACGPGRTTFASYPNAPAKFDRAASEPKALEIADKVFAAAGGPGNWEKAKQVRWHQTITSDGKVTLDAETAWDRWNGRPWAKLIQGEQALVVAYELYGDLKIGFAEEKEGRKKSNFDESTRTTYVNKAREQFNVATAVLALQFMLFEPGAKIGYIGPANDDAGAEKYDQLKVTFDEPMRKDLEFHLVVDRATNLPHRIEVVRGMEKIGYTLTNWVTVNGMKFATARGNMGYSGESIAIKDIKVSDPEDDLYIAPLAH